MLAHTVPARLRPEASLAALERAVARATVLRGERGEAAEVAAPLLRQVEEDGAGPRVRGGNEGEAMKPAARRTGLVVRELPGELIVYDLGRHQAHCLNRTAASVFRAADGTRSLDELGGSSATGSTSRSSGGRGSNGPRPARAPRSCLDPRCPRPAPREGLSRRSALRRAGLGAALLLPAIASVVAPTPAEAAVRPAPRTARASCPALPATARRAPPRLPATAPATAPHLHRLLIPARGGTRARRGPAGGARARRPRADARPVALVLAGLVEDPAALEQEVLDALGERLARRRGRPA